MATTTEGICTVATCDRPALAKGLCDPHYKRMRKHGDVLADAPIENRRNSKRGQATCSIRGCGKHVKGNDLCGMHYMRAKRHGDPAKGAKVERPVVCSVEGCTGRHHSFGYCVEHAGRFKRHGDPLGGRQGPPAYRYLTSKGYVIVRAVGHLNAGKKGHLPEHVLVMSRALGRPLREGETVHHRNGIRDDNRLENLELWAQMHSSGQRVTDLVAFAREVLAAYEDDIDKLAVAGSAA